MGTSDEATQRLIERGAVTADPVRSSWGRISWLTDDARHGVGLTLGYVEIEPGQQNPLHIHDNCHEVVCLLAGRISHVVADEVVEMEAEDLLIVPPGTVHRATNTGDTVARMIVAYDAGKRGFRIVD